MKKAEAEKLIQTIQSFVDAVPDDPRAPLKPKEVGRLDTESIPPGATVAAGGRIFREQHTDEEALYRRFKARLLEDLKTDPVYLKLLATMPEILVEIEPRVVELSETKLKGRVAMLASRGFLAECRTHGAILKELARTGSQTHPARLSEGLAEMVTDGFLTREDDGYRLAPGVKVSTRDLRKAG